MRVTQYKMGLSHVITFVTYCSVKAHITTKAGLRTYGKNASVVAASDTGTLFHWLKIK